MDQFVQLYESCCKACEVEPIELVIDAVGNAAEMIKLQGGEDDKYAEEEVDEREEEKEVPVLQQSIALTLNGNSLELFGRRVTSADVKALAAAASKTLGLFISELSLGYNEIDDAGMESVMNIVLCWQVQRLDLRSNSIGPDGLQMLLDALASTKCSLSHVVLRDNPLGNKGGLGLAQLLFTDDLLVHLDVGSCELETESLIAIATALRSNNSLEVLYLDNPHVFSFDNEVTTHLSNMIALNSKLHTLSLSKHRIRCSDVAILAEGLAANTSMRALNLRCNEISVAGAKSLTLLLLSEGNRLVDLNLEGNCVADEGAAAIGSALEFTKSLQTLNLRSNLIKDKGLATFAEGMALNSSLITLKLWGNDFGPVSSKLFAELYKGRFQYNNIRLDFCPWHVDAESVHVAQDE